MINFNKINLLIFLLIISVLIVGFFVYQWWLVENELIKQTLEKEELIRQFEEIKAKEKISFVQCRELKVFKEDAIAIYLLDAMLPVQRSPWNIAVVDPDGFVIGYGGLPAWEGPMEAQTPFDVDENGTIDFRIVGGGRKIGDHLLIIMSTPETQPGDTYGLRLSNLVLAKNIPYSPNFLDRFYILRQTETGIIPIVPSSVGCQF